MIDEDNVVDTTAMPAASRNRGHIVMILAVYSSTV